MNVLEISKKFSNDFLLNASRNATVQAFELSNDPQEIRLIAMDYFFAMMMGFEI